MEGGLREAFLRDHRVLTRGLQQIRQALQREDISAAAELAQQLDLQIGPHMEFEETVLYPRLIKPLGRTYVRQLYREHSEGREALGQLVSLAGSSGVKRDLMGLSDKEVLISRLDAILEHALGCGSLLSHVDHLPVSEQRYMLEQLECLGRQARKWTDSPSRRG